MLATYPSTSTSTRTRNTRPVERCRIDGESGPVGTCSCWNLGPNETPARRDAYLADVLSWEASLVARGIVAR